MSGHTIVIFQVIMTFPLQFSVFLPQILKSLLLLLGPFNSSVPYCALPVALTVSLISQIFLKRPLAIPILLFSSISLHCLFKKAFLSFLDILWILRSVEHIFPFLLCLLLLLFSQLQGLLRQPLCLLAFWGVGDGFGHCLLYSVMNSIPSYSGTLSIRSNPLNLFATSTV